jgi:hypothetical protein
LIKICHRLLIEFDAEQGLDAGVEVERLTGPAGSDGVGVGMLEAVHNCILITFRQLLAALGECEVPGQVLVADP